jgi:hypothetical protein
MKLPYLQKKLRLFKEMELSNKEKELKGYFTGEIHRPG